jgi:anti-anti-sigma factor
MEVVCERGVSWLLVRLSGRLDAFGAQKLDEELKACIRETDSFIVLDMAGVVYLSSGGLRVILAADKTLRKRKGILRLCNIVEYPMQVIRMAGLEGVLVINNSCDDALAACEVESRAMTVEKDWQHLPVFHRSGASIRVYQNSGQPAGLKVAGNLMKVLHATIENGDVIKRHFIDTEYSIGLGALGPNVDESKQFLGEMITLGGTMVWLPTDGHDSPDFFSPQKDTGQVVIYTGLNVALDGVFNEVMLLDATVEHAVSLSDIYEGVFMLAKERSVRFGGLVSIAMLADIAGLSSSGVKIAPIRELSPVNGGMITDPENIGRWMDITPGARHQGKTMISFGVGLDLSTDHTMYDPEVLSNLFYLHPANVGGKTMMLHNHGVVFEKVHWKHTLGLDAEIRHIARNAQFVDMRHLLDNTRVSKAILGVSYISRLSQE